MSVDRMDRDFHFQFSFTIPPTQGFANVKFAPETEPELLLGAGWEGRASWCETARPHVRHR